MKINKFENELRSLLSDRFSVTEGIRANYARGEDIFEPVLPMGVVFPKTTDEEFEQIFMHVLNQGAKDNTYKFAFARFLLEYSQIKTETHVEFSTIAEYYLKYYLHHPIYSGLNHQLTFQIN